MFSPAGIGPYPAEGPFAGYRKMQIKLNEEAKKVISAAKETAKSLGYSEVGSEHMLLGVLAHPAAATAEALAEHGIKPEILFKEIQANLPSGPGSSPGELQYNKSSKDTFAAASKEAEFYRVEEISQEHILLGILGNDKNPAFALFKAASGGAQDKVRKGIKDILGKVLKRREMTARFNEQASALVLNARREAESRKNEFIEPEHMLAAILAFPGSAAMAALMRMKVNMKILNAMLGRFLSEIPKRKDKDAGLSFSDAAKKALDGTVEAAESMKSLHIGPEHFLLGIMGMEGSNPQLALKEAGVKSLKDLREEVDMVLAAQR